MTRTFATVAIYVLFVYGMRGQSPHSAEDRAHLLALAREMRPHWEHMLKAAELIQKTPSIQERERIYCHSQAYAFPLIPQVGTVEEMESNFTQLAAQEQATQAEQVKRQYALQGAREQLAQAYENMQTCIDLFANGWQAFPTNEQEANFVDNMRRALRAIDHPDASLAPSSVDLPTTTPLPDGALAKWEQECRQWQENNLSTLTQLPHGEVTRIMNSAAPQQECGLSAEITDRSGTHRLTFMRPGPRQIIMK
jgi:hypothetical protein